MQIRICSCEFDEKTGTTTAIARTPIGEFTGVAKFNKDKDPFEPSKIVGINIAESRAYIAAYNEAIKLKREQIKGLKRIIGSCGNKDKSTICHYTNQIIKSIDYEIEALKDEKKEYSDVIKYYLEARRIYLRSRSTNREEKEKYLEGIKQGLKDLGQFSSKEKE